MMDWLYMGGYWPYVWPCYLLTAAAVGAEYLSCAAGFRRRGARGATTRRPLAE